MNRDNLINRLVTRKMNLGGNRKPICICMASVAGTMQQRPAPANPVK